MVSKYAPQVTHHSRGTWQILLYSSDYSNGMKRRHDTIRREGHHITSVVFLPQMREWKQEETPDKPQRRDILQNNTSFKMVMKDKDKLRNFSRLKETKVT